MSKAFTREQIKRILRSPAVLEVNGNRIRYSEEFKIHLFGELSKGGKPGQVFREVGLPSELVGQKRIDRTVGHSPFLQKQTKPEKDQNLHFHIQQNRQIKHRFSPLHLEKASGSDSCGAGRRLPRRMP